MSASDFSKLLIWQRSMGLAKIVYEITKCFPKEELYGLVSQMRRSAVSVPSNIAEGSQRNSPKDFANFISIAKGSLAELQTQLLLSAQLGYSLDQKDLNEIQQEIEEISRMLHSFHSQLIPHTS